MGAKAMYDEEALARIRSGLSLIDGAAEQFEEAIFALDFNRPLSVEKHDGRGKAMLTHAFTLAPELIALMPKLHADFSAGDFLAREHAEIAAEVKAIQAALESGTN